MTSYRIDFMPFSSLYTETISSSVSGLSSIVSAVVKRNQDEAFLLRDYEGKGLWLPCTEVKNGETCVTAAQRLGFEVIMIVISLYT